METSPKKRKQRIEDEENRRPRREMDISTSGNACCKRRPATSDPFKQTSKEFKEGSQRNAKWHPKEWRMRRSKRRGEVEEDVEGGHDGNQGDLGFLNKPLPWDGPTEIRSELGHGFMPRGRVCGRTAPPCLARMAILQWERDSHWLRRERWGCWCCTPLAGPCRPPDLRRLLLQPAPRLPLCRPGSQARPRGAAVGGSFKPRRAAARCLRNGQQRVWNQPVGIPSCPIHSHPSSSAVSSRRCTPRFVQTMG